MNPELTNGNNANQGDEHDPKYQDVQRESYRSNNTNHQGDKTMRPDQFFETENDLANNYLERGLHDIARAGYAIQSVLCCLNEVRTRPQPQEEDDYRYLDDVKPGALDDAILILGKFVYETSNDLCDRFGIVQGV